MYTIQELKNVYDEGKGIYPSSELSKYIKRLTAYLPISALPKQRLWHIINNSVNGPTCITCGSPTKWNSAQPNKTQQYRLFCSNRCSCNAPQHIKDKRATSALTVEEFISDAKLVHGDLYDYSCVDYKGACESVTIICKIHGPFEQAAHVHKSGSGCRKCSNERIGKKNSDRGKILFSISHNEFLRKAMEKHGFKYSYDLTKYQNYYTKVTINCPIHGSWEVTPDAHIHGSGCPTCAHTSKSSQMAINWLTIVAGRDNIHIQHAQNGGEYVIPNTNLKVDGYCVATNTIYEFHGNKWHGNPLLFTSTDHCHPFDKNITAGELYERTLKRQNKLQQLGYNLVVCWESEL